MQWLTVFFGPPWIFLLITASFKKLLEKEKHLEDADTSNNETEPEAELTAAG